MTIRSFHAQQLLRPATKSAEIENILSKAIKSCTDLSLCFGFVRYTAQLRQVNGVCHEADERRRTVPLSSDV